MNSIRQTMGNRFAQIAFCMALLGLVFGSSAFAQTDASGVLDSVTTLITSWKGVMAGLVLFLIGVRIVRKLR